MVVSCFAFENEVLKPVPVSVLKLFRPRGYVLTNFMTYAQMVWTNVWDGYKRMKPPESGSGSVMAKMLYTALSEPGNIESAWLLIDAFVYDMRYPHAEIKQKVVNGVTYKYPVVNLPLVEYSWCGQQPYRIVNGYVRIVDWTYDSLAAFLGDCRSFRKTDDKGYSALTVGYYYGVMYMSSHMTDLLNWYNLMWEIDMSDIDYYVIQPKNSYVLQGIVTAIVEKNNLLKRPMPVILVVGSKVNASDYTTGCQIVSYPNSSAQDIMRIENAEGVRSAPVERTVVIYTQGPDIYAAFSKRSNVLNDTERLYKRDVSMVPDSIRMIRLVPICAVTLELCVEKEWRLGVSAEPHNMLLVAYQRVAQDSVVSQWFRASPVKTMGDFTRFVHLFVIANLIRNTAVLSLEFDRYCKSHGLPAPYFINNVPVKPGVPKQRHRSGVVMSDATQSPIILDESDLQVLIEEGERRGYYRDEFVEEYVPPQGQNAPPPQLASYVPPRAPTNLIFNIDSGVDDYLG
jgi:hypothetical protein